MTTPLTGREGEHAAITAFAAATQRPRVLCLVGGCGCGKTTTVTRVAQRAAITSTYVNAATTSRALMVEQACRDLPPASPLAAAIAAALRGATGPPPPTAGESLWLIMDEVDAAPRGGGAALRRLVKECVSGRLSGLRLTLIGNDRAMPIVAAYRNPDVAVLTFGAYANDTLRRIGAEATAAAHLNLSDAALSFAVQHTAHEHAADARRICEICSNAPRSAKRERDAGPSAPVFLRDVLATAGASVTAAGVESSTLLMKQVLACCCRLQQRKAGSSMTGAAVISAFHGVVRTLGAATLPPSHDALLEALANWVDVGLLRVERGGATAAALRRYRLAVEPRELEPHLQAVTGAWYPAMD